MSISLIGIILVQLYWFNMSVDNNQDQFKYHVKQVIGNVSEKLQQKEAMTFLERFNKMVDSTGSHNLDADFLEFGYYERNSRTNEMVIYSSSVVSEDFNISPSFFDKKFDSLRFKNISAARRTEIYDGKFDNQYSNNRFPDVSVESNEKLSVLEKAKFEMNFKDIAATYPIQRRVSVEDLRNLLSKELREYGVNTPFEFGIYSNGLATKVKSENFKFDLQNTYSIPVFTDNSGESKYQLLVSFPEKKKFLLSNLVGITLLSIVFTLIILIAYSNALSQIFKHRQISEIKTDFINNMTHEFKTPIATINLALDAIKNPKVLNDADKVTRYLQMIRDENKRMHAQVENVLRISKLEKKELDIPKQQYDISQIIEDAVEHVSLIVEDRQGTINMHLNAKRTTALLNDVHFTNVMVNILDNAIKYSPEAPIIDVTTENVKDYVLIKVTDQGAGMSKVAQKKIFEKFYREHTGDIHNVKGHGLGLAYVKRIVDEHNGQIYVESEKGKGSTFIIKIPLIN